MSSALAQGTAGAQAIRRAVHLLKLLPRRGAHGWALSELTRASGLNHATTRRILQCLAEERLVTRDPDSRRYRLGPLNYELGMACEHRLDFRARLRPVLERIAAISGETVYLHIRSGLETLCIDRVDGSFPIRAVTLEIGGRRPLGFGSAGLAILARLPRDEVEEVLDLLQPEIERNPRVTRQSLAKAAEQARELGYGVIRDTTVMGVSAVGVATPERGDLPVLGVGLAMVNERFSAARARSLHELLMDELSQL